MRVGHNWDDQAVTGLRNEAEVDPLGHDDLFLNRSILSSTVSEDTLASVA